jgi:hypothetical protein
MSALSPSLAPAFLAAASELGMASAARLFLREIAAAGGPPLVAAARDAFGREYPVFHCLATHWLASQRVTAPQTEAMQDAVSGLARLLVVGLEVDWLDALLPRLAGVEVGLLREDLGVAADFRRILANYGGRVVDVELADLQRWAGRRSGLMAFVYGSDGHVAHVPGVWLRVSGPDVRTQFSALIGWNILGGRMEVYPRWLAETSVGDFSRLVGP